MVAENRPMLISSPGIGEIIRIGEDLAVTVMGRGNGQFVRESPRSGTWSRIGMESDHGRIKRSPLQDMYRRA